MTEDNLPQAIERQSAAAAEEADVIVMVVDGLNGITTLDAEIMEWLQDRFLG